MTLLSTKIKNWTNFCGDFVAEIRKSGYLKTLSLSYFMLFAFNLTGFHRKLSTISFFSDVKKL